MRYCKSVVNGELVDNADGFLKLDLFVQPDAEERRYLLEELKLGEHTLNSALDPDESPRIEIERNYIAIILKIPMPHFGEEDFVFKVGSGGLFLLSDSRLVVVTREWKLSQKRLPGSRHGKTVETVNTVQECLLILLSQTIRAFEAALKRISRRKDQLQEMMKTSTENKTLEKMFVLRESLIYYAEALRGNGYLFERLRMAAAKIGFTPENLEILEDDSIENQQFLEEAQVYSQVLSDLMDMWTTVINNNLNNTMKNMNSLVVAISIPAFFTGLLGMSEYTSVTSPYLPWYVSYPLFIGVMFLLATSVHVLVRHHYRN